MQRTTSTRSRLVRAGGLALGAVALLFCSCSNSSDDDTPPPAFTTFVTNLIDDTADDTEPVSLDGRTFTFSEDPEAFADLFE